LRYRVNKTGELRDIVPFWTGRTLGYDGTGKMGALQRGSRRNNIDIQCQFHRLLHHRRGINDFLLVNSVIHFLTASQLCIQPDLLLFKRYISLWFPQRSAKRSAKILHTGWVSWEGSSVMTASVSAAGVSTVGGTTTSCYEDPLRRVYF
jgi:hypothetical protein